MALAARSTGGNNKEQPENKMHDARLVGLVDYGHQPPFMWEGKMTESKYKVGFVYELVDTSMEESGRPFWIEESVNVSDYEPKKPGQITSTMMKRVRTLDGINGDSNNGKNLTGLLNKPCQVETQINDNGYAKLMGVSKASDKYEYAELRNPTTVFNMDEPDLDVFLKFPEFKQNKIKQALDFPGSALESALLKAGEDTSTGAEY